MTGSATAAGATRRDWAIVGAAYVVLVIVAATWLALDRHPPEWDYANHLERSVACAADLARGDLTTLLARSSFYPPLVPCAAALVYAVAPVREASAQAIILAFLGLGMAATYALARPWAGGAGAVVAAITFGTAPFVVHLALRFQLDLPLAAMVAAFLWALQRTDHFGSPGWSVAAGAVAGLGLLTKPPFLAYVLPPLLLVLAGARGLARWRNALAAGLVAVLLALPWYGPRLLGMSTQVSARSFGQAERAGHPDPLSLEALRYYPAAVPEQVGWVAAVLLVVGLIVAVRRRYWFVVAGLLPLIGFLLIRNKNLRYTLPLVPMAATCVGLGFVTLGRRARVATAVVLAIAAVLQVSSVAFGVPAALRQPLAGVELTISSPPDRSDWRHQEILALIARDAAGAPVTVSVPPNNPWFSAANFRYYSLRAGLPFRVVRAWDEEPVGVDYMILKTGDIGPGYTIAKAMLVTERLARDSHLARVFPVIGEFSLPDGSRADVRARRVTAVTAPAAEVAEGVRAGFARRVPELAVDIEGLRVELEHDAGIVRGHVRRLRVAAAAATVGDLRHARSARVRVRNLQVTLDSLVVNPFSAVAEHRFDPLVVGRLRVDRLTVAAADLRSFLDSGKAGTRMAVAFGPGFADVRLALFGPDIQARVRLVPATGRPFAVLAEQVHLGGVPFPGLLARWVTRNFDPSPGLAERLPFPVEIGRLELAPDGIHVGAP